MTDIERAIELQKLIEDHRQAKATCRFLARRLSDTGRRLFGIAQQLMQEQFEAAVVNAELDAADNARIPELLCEWNEAHAELDRTLRDLARLGLEVRP